MLLSWFNEQRHRSRSASPRCALSFAAQREGQRVEGEDGERGNWASALATCMLRQCAWPLAPEERGSIDSSAVQRTVRFTLAGRCDKDRLWAARAAG